MMCAWWLTFRHKDTSSVDAVELCACLTSAVDKRRSIADHADQFGHTPLHLAARRGAGVCAIHLIQVDMSTASVLTTFVLTVVSRRSLISRFHVGFSIHLFQNRTREWQIPRVVTGQMPFMLPTVIVKALKVTQCTDYNWDNHPPVLLSSSFLESLLHWWGESRCSLYYASFPVPLQVFVSLCSHKRNAFKVTCSVFGGFNLSLFIGAVTHGILSIMGSPCIGA